LLNMMFDHPKFDHYGFEEIPLDQDIFLVGAEWLVPYEQMMLRFFDGAEYESVGFISWVVATGVSQNGIELTWHLTFSTRYHGIKIVLPRSEFIDCIGCWDASERPRIFVTDKWLNHIHLRNYSVFGLVDAVGFKDRIKRNDLSQELLLELRSGVDDLAEHYPDLTIISFGDSLLLKSNWTVGMFDSEVSYTYAPEQLLEVFRRLQELYQRSLEMEIYAVFTQGANEYFGSAPLHISKSGRHIGMNCLGVPFERLFAIDEAARKAIRSKYHSPSQLYLDLEYFTSLRLPHEFQSRKERAEYTSKMSDGAQHYVMSNVDELDAALEKQSQLHERMLAEAKRDNR